MGKIYTSRYSNRDLQTADVVKVGISAGLPKFPLKYELTANIIDLAPGRSIFRMTDKEAFRQKYWAQLDRIGIAVIRQLLVDAWKKGGMEKDLVLLCYEDVTCDDEKKNWCHRTILAEWLRSKLGFEIAEYPDSGNFAAKHKEEPKAEEDDGFEQMNLF